MAITILLIAACSDSSNIEHFSSKEKALENFIGDENIKGNIDLITTTKTEKILVTQQSENIYFVGEFKEDEEEFYAVRISDNVQMETGASWELITMDGNEYTIFFKKTTVEPYFIQLSNEEYYISVVDGHMSDEKSALTNVIEGVEIVKK